MNNKIQMIAASKLEHHPKNPRKEIGDIEELTASIRVSGILQNLTVVPNTESSGKYLVVIGNRRLEAGKAAGVTEFPCVVSDMDESKQLETMLVENIQRTDLTMSEQAKGFHQLQLAGFTVDEIADKTGFSRQTVNRRLKLVEYSGKKVDDAMARGGTLADFAKLEDITDKKKREKLIGYVGTNNFDREYQWAIKDQREKENKKTLRKMLKGKATEVKDDDYSEWDSRCKYERDRRMPKIDTRNSLYSGAPIEMKGDYEHFFCFTYSDCVFLKLKSKAAKTDGKPIHTQQQKQWERNRRQLNKLAEEFFELRKAFVESIKERKSFKDWQNICIEYALKLGFIHGSMNIAPDWSFIKEHGFDGYKDSMQKRMQEFSAYCEEHAAGTLIYFIYSSCGDNSCINYHVNYQYEQPKGRKNETLTVIYEFLCAFGYQMSDEEKQWQTGTHPLQQK